MSEQRILIVDDDPDVVESVSSFLEANGYQVLKAHNGREGLTQAKLEHPDLIIMDIMMNERTEGFFTVQSIRHTPGLESVPIFVLSSLYQQVPSFRIPPDSGWLACDQFFPKPANMPELLKNIRQSLGRRPLAPLPDGRDSDPSRDRAPSGQGAEEPNHAARDLDRSER